VVARSAQGSRWSAARQQQAADENYCNDNWYESITHRFSPPKVKIGGFLNGWRVVTRLWNSVFCYLLTYAD